MHARALKNPGDDDACVFLEKGVCLAYEQRPLICRTHGFPILVDDMIDFCEMNFLNLEEIDIDLIIDLDELNTRLGEINIEFIKESPDPRFKQDRIPLRNIVIT
jgi:Fe-S-cluster containining protein